MSGVALQNCRLPARRQVEMCKHVSSVADAFASIYSRSLSKDCI